MYGLSVCYGECFGEILRETRICSWHSWSERKHKVDRSYICGVEGKLKEVVRSFCREYDLCVLLVRE